MWQKQIAPSEFDSMQYWEFEYYIDLMNERNKEESKRNKEQSDEQSTNMPKIPNYKNIGKNFKPPKM